MSEIAFTQYLRPNGRRVRVTAPVSDEAYSLAMEILAAGYVFEVEELMNGLVSQTVSDDDSDIAIRVSANGPAVTDAREELIREAVEIVRERKRGE